MGVICPCGVTVDACAENKPVKFHKVWKKVKGNLTYKANICVTTLPSSTLSLRFEDIDTPDRFSFLFTANCITSITCNKERYHCTVTVKGTGTVGMMEYPFEAVFLDQVSQSANDIVQSFVIKGFFNQKCAVQVPQGSIVALGCQEM
ncbi:hypothetical protein AEA09_09455 [Lysinibacillus contaminans]|uniref:Uncharacterized protein n=1 Tax=Lysinibacillus contaminans TaxID=1293441 RepID=A0ABR5K1L8_9BACI|nr:hypothetical protein [Lysinibacillus contaminans]KOS68741.1 hypothetical protein AEA09_09455 [Lysinibacillus contaminans]